jgi:hypothetical protein
MHTAICAFDTHEQARQAVDALERAGFARHDLHIEHKQSTSEGRAPNDAWDGLEREVAVDRSVLSSFGHFFASLLGRDHPSGHVDTYTQHVERGGHVVVVDAHDDAEAQRAGALLRELQASDLNVVPRPEQRPLRDIVGMRQAQGDGEAVNRSNDTYEAAGSFGSPAMEHATAAHRISPTAGPDLRDPETEHAPGMRYVDKDKPL